MLSWPPTLQSRLRVDVPAAECLRGPFLRSCTRLARLLEGRGGRRSRTPRFWLFKVALSREPEITALASKMCPALVSFAGKGSATTNRGPFVDGDTTLPGVCADCYASRPRQTHRKVANRGCHATCYSSTTKAHGSFKPPPPHPQHSIVIKNKIFDDTTPFCTLIISFISSTPPTLKNVAMALATSGLSSVHSLKHEREDHLKHQTTHRKGARRPHR